MKSIKKLSVYVLPVLRTDFKWKVNVPSNAEKLRNNLPKTRKVN